MISKCSKVVLTRKKFSEFDDGDVKDDSLYIVGVQEVDGELTNVKIKMSDILDYGDHTTAYVIDDLKVPHTECEYDDLPEGVDYCPCLNGGTFIFDVLVTGRFIQLNSLPWTTDDAKGEYFFNIQFQNLPLGATMKIYFANVHGVNEPNEGGEYSELVYPEYRVYLYGLSPQDAKLVDTTGLNLRSEVLMFTEEELNAAAQQNFNHYGTKGYLDFFVRFIQLSAKLPAKRNASGQYVKIANCPCPCPHPGGKVVVRRTRVAEVLNLYDGNFTGEDLDI